MERSVGSEPATVGTGGDGTTSGEPELIVSETGPIAWITLNRPARKNALTIPMREGFLRAVREIDQRDDIRCLVIRGTGGAFCAGGDVGAQVERAQTPVSAAELRRNYLALPGACALALLRSRKPTLAAIDGPAAGAGASMALLCDIRLASARAFLVVPFLDRGLVPDWLLMHVLPAYVGMGRSMDIFYLQERISAETATSLGLFSSVHPAEEFAAVVQQTAERLAALPPVAVEIMKTTLRAQLGDLETLLANEALAQGTCLMTADHAEGAAAFVERRRPNFVGR
jgi:2-(1,2-epoxy-1,2-dihydrophenyl)acetyl-CoA isomerase